MSADHILKPGTPCFLVNLVEMEALCGRVVEVVEGPLHAPEQVWASITSLLHGSNRCFRVPA